MLKFELVLPCYNESKSLRFLIERAVAAAKEMNFNSTNFKLVLVENGSKDDSITVLKNLTDSPLGDWLKVVYVPVNQGYGFGLRSGLKATEAPYVGWSHADQQCDPKDAFIALRKILDQPGSHLVKGVRHGRAARDRFVSWVFRVFARLILGLDIDEINAQPKVCTRNLLDLALDPPKTFAFDLYMLYVAKKNNFQFDTVPVLFPPRVHGVSNWAATFLGRYKTIWGMIQYMYSLAKAEGRL